LECWNNGFGAIGSIFFVCSIGNKNQANIRFSYPILHFSIIPSFHGLLNDNHYSAGLKSKSELLGQDSLFHTGRPVTEFISQSARIVKTMKIWNGSTESAILILFVP